MVIQITPQTELANSLTGEARLPGEARPPGESSGIQHIHGQGGESPHKAKAAKSRLGVFAQILSGLRKTGAGEKATGGIKPDASGKTSESDVLRSVQKSKNKLGKGLSKAEKTGEIEPEFELQLQAAGLSAQEKNTLFAAGCLAGEFTDENLQSADKGVTADSVAFLGRPNGGEATETETVQIVKAGLEGGKQFETVAVTTGESGKDLKQIGRAHV